MMTRNPRNLLLLWLFWVLGCGVLAAAPEVLKIATWNIYNDGQMDRRAHDRWLPGYPKPEGEKRAVRAALLDVVPDIISFQEAGNEEHLRLWQRELRVLGLDYPYSAWTQGEDKVRHLGMLSKYPLRILERGDEIDFPYRGERIRLRRGLLGVEVQTAAGPLHLWVVHLKSKWTEFEDDPQATRKRTGEATAIRDYLHRMYREGEGPLFAVLGDFNDTLASAPLRRFLQRGERRLLHALELADSRGHRWTHHWERHDIYTRIDYILVSPALKERFQDGAIFDSPWATEASDHRLLHATFDLSP